MSIAIVMGSDSDWRILEDAQTTLIEFGIKPEVEVLSAHRTPEAMLDWSSKAADRGVKVIIAGAGGAAHLPGMVASATSLPVIGVPISLKNLEGIDSLLSIAQMPAGVPVATMAIDGAKNAALMAIRILGTADSTLFSKMNDYRSDLKVQVAAKNQKLKDSLD
jgi:5-(carboxyamino)imidazole ribonucleotide mutase